MPDLDALDRAELIRLILELYRQNEQLRKQIEELRRKQHRSAAPFSKGSKKNNPKRPGRKPGQGLFDRRRAPQTEPFIPPIEVPLRQTQCPFCGGRLDAEEEWTEEASVTDMPSQPQPEANLFRVGVLSAAGCAARRCGASIPEVAPGQYSGTAHGLGPRVKAMAHSLHYGHGVPVRRLPAVLREMTGIELAGTRHHPGRLRSKPRGESGMPIGSCGRKSEKRQWCIPTTPVGGSAETGPI